jgi:hypothetical protein
MQHQNKQFEIDFNNRTSEQIKFTADFIIKVVAPIVTKHNGKIFGGFIRDIIIPYTQFCQELTPLNNFKDVDFWFPSQEDLFNFLKEAPIKSNNFDWMLNPSNSNSLYEFATFNGLLKKESLPLSFVDLVVSPEFPVNDFDINAVAFDMEDGRIRLEPMSTIDTLEKLVENVRNKMVYMRPTYLFKIENANKFHKNLILDRIQNRYINRGWKVMVDKDKEFVIKYVL